MTKNRIGFCKRAIGGFLGLAFLASQGYAQGKGEPLKTSQNTVQSVPTTQLQLEETIRADRQQPQVLTIVPWQLPIHKRVDADLQWYRLPAKLEPLSRAQFLQKIQRR